MKLQTEIEERDGCMWITAAGVWRLDDILELIDLIGAEARSRQIPRVVVDIRQIDGDPPDMDRFRAGEHTATVLGSRIRTAVIGRAETLNRFAEGVARQSGARMQVFSDEGQATEWITGDEPG